MKNEKKNDISAGVSDGSGAAGFGAGFGHLRGCSAYRCSKRDTDRVGEQGKKRRSASSPRFQVAQGAGGGDRQAAQGAGQGQDGEGYFTCTLQGEKSRGVVGKGISARYAMIGQLSPMYTVRKLCHVLNVSRAGYYAWRSRRSSRRWHDDQRFMVAILAAHNRTRQTYGARRLQPELASKGYMAGRDRISRLRRELGLRCKQRRKYRVTTDSNHKLPVAENKVGRNFHATGPDQLWLADITCLPVDEVWVYLAGIKDMFTRQIVGHSMADRMGTELVRDALENALRSKKPTAGMVSDRGSQYCAADYRNVLKRHGIAVSMSRSGDCYDNAPMESF